MGLSNYFQLGSTLINNSPKRLFVEVFLQVGLSGISSYQVKSREAPSMGSCEPIYPTF